MMQFILYSSANHKSSKKNEKIQKLWDIDWSLKADFWGWRTNLNGIDKIRAGDNVGCIKDNFLESNDSENLKNKIQRRKKNF